MKKSMLGKTLALFLILLSCVCACAQADSYVYSNEAALNAYYVCEDFDKAIPDALRGAFDSRIMEGDEILCGTLRRERRHSDPSAVEEEDALLALERAGKVLLLGAKKTDGVWRCAIETDSFFAPGDRFDLTVLPEHGASGAMRSASPAIVCGGEEFFLRIQEDGSIHLRQYREMQQDGSALEILVEMGQLYARRTLEGVEQESGMAAGVIPARLCGWTYETFPRTCAGVNAWEGRGMTALGEDEVFIFGVNFREKPTGQSRSMGKYTAKARVLDRREGTTSPWYQVQVGDTTGWVSGTYVVWPQSERGRLDTAAYLSKTPDFARANGQTPLYRAPDGEEIMQLPAGTAVQVIAQNDGWLHVIVPRHDGWQIDWDGTYGYVRQSGVTTGVSPADIHHP